mmetsp:Transcript_23318/g.39521  ORF Transcript_23318/g.39521 Transcript_23318/m.39521 type:complete len:158 (+) Transcript_23318:1610-2083(+)
MSVRVCLLVCLMGAVISVIYPGDPEQCLVAVLISLVYLKIHTHSMPFLESDMNILSEVSMYQIFFTFFCTLIIQNELMTGAWLDFLGILLLGANLSVVFFMVYFGYEKRQAVKEKRRHRNSLQEAVREGADKFPEEVAGVEMTTVDAMAKNNATSTN